MQKKVYTQLCNNSGSKGMMRYLGNYYLRRSRNSISDDAEENQCKFVNPLCLFYLCPSCNDNNDP